MYSKENPDEYKAPNLILAKHYFFAFIGGIKTCPGAIKYMIPPCTS